ncbi:MAG: tetratricopeptide repeat protein [Acidobacteria bacterium]|nr:tetratricopeptide repeat protein [Acidobacteriota bacterium]
MEMWDLGVALAAEGHFEEANRAFAAALETEPRNPEIRFNFGVALTRQRNWPAAADEFARVTALRPGRPAAHCSLAGALFQAGEKERAQAELGRARQSGPCELPQGR